MVTIPEATDGVNADELKDGVQTEVTVPGGSAAGDTLTLTITKPDGSTDTVEHTLTADEVTAGKADVTIPADKVTADGNYSVTAEITDPAVIPVVRVNLLTLWLIRKFRAIQTVMVWWIQHR
ncbi:Uncharacterised protein [Proteus mirabilis]|uniref:RTX family exoprotein A n=1 Tax=Proteus mirabilis TaxID=584 RepID=A0A379FID4_PROMI|nr:Uncharacterised protein [Proteus mirabilis]